MTRWGCAPGGHRAWDGCGEDFLEGHSTVRVGGVGPGGGDGWGWKWGEGCPRLAVLMGSGSPACSYPYLQGSPRHRVVSGGPGHRPETALIGSRVTRGIRRGELGLGWAPGVGRFQAARSSLAGFWYLGLPGKPEAAFDHGGQASTC